MTSSLKQNKTDSQAARRETWERWVNVWHVVFYLALIIPTGLALFGERMRYPSWLVLVLGTVLGIWYGVVMIWLVSRMREKWQVAWSVMYLVGALALWFLLARCHWAYFITASSFYGLMWGTLPFGLAVAGNILLTGLLIWIQALNLNQPLTISWDLIIIGLVAISWSALLALWMRSIMRESTKRKQLIEQLRAAQDDLAAAERQAGILQERQRMAQEIHDTLAQGFTSIVMQLEAAEAAFTDEGNPAQNHISKARDTARSSLTEARRLVQALRPTQLEDAPLIVALRRVVERWKLETGTQADFMVTGEPHPLHPDVEVTLLRVVQEGLVNVQKHAMAGQVNVTLSYMDHQVALDIQDDGCGFDPEKVQSGSVQEGNRYGLQAMRERVAQLNGEVILESAPRVGTTVVIQIPTEEQE